VSYILALGSAHSMHWEAGSNCECNRQLWTSLMQDGMQSQGYSYGPQSTISSTAVAAFTSHNAGFVEPAGSEM
jgi:hypothetical protein